MQWIAELSGGYQILNVKGPFSAGPKDKRGTVAELYAGGRYYAVKLELDAQFGGTSNRVGEWEAWVDAIVGARIGIDLSKTVVFGIQGDVGGFDLGARDWRHAARHADPRARHCRNRSLLG